MFSGILFKGWKCEQAKLHFQQDVIEGYSKEDVLKYRLSADEVAALSHMPVKPVAYSDLNNFKIDGSLLRGHDAGHGRSSYCKVNQFMLSTLYNLGGSETYSIKQRMSSMRYGGGREDSIVYLKKYNNSFYNKDVSFSMSARRMIKVMGLSGETLVPLSLEQVRLGTDLNLSANPGPQYKAVGGKTKLDCYDLIFEVAKFTYAALGRGETPPFPVYGLSGRAKFLTRRSKILKELDDKAVGRAVWMADAHEPILAGVFTLPLLELFKKIESVIALGYNKFGPDSPRMKDRFERYDTWICGDISSLDANCLNALIDRAFLIIKILFNLTDSSKEGRLLLWLQAQYKYTRLAMPDSQVICKPGGGPSGSGFISIINSLVVSICYIEAITSIYGGRRTIKWDLIVYGDNSVFGFYTHYTNDDLRRKAGERLVTRLADFLSERYNLKLNPLESRVAAHFLVRYGQPIVPEALRDFSSDAIRIYRAQKEIQLGRKLRLDEKVKILPSCPEGPAIGGNTHRWTYVFKDSVVFLSYSWLEGGQMIRPTAEVIDRLLHPERNVSLIEQHETRMRSALVENQYNQHTVNRLMHYFIDSDWMKKNGILTAQDAKHDVIQCKMSPPVPADRSLLPYEYEGRKGRAWYRRQSKTVNLETEPFYYNFFLWWVDLLQSLPNAFDASISRLFSDRSLRRHIMAGQKGLKNLMFSRQWTTRENLLRYVNFMGVIVGSGFYNSMQFAPLITDSDEEIKKKALMICNGLLIVKAKAPDPTEFIAHQVPRN